MNSRTRTFGEEVHKSNIRVTRWHNKYKISNCIERHNFCLSDLLTNSNRTTLQSYKVEERTFGTPCILIAVCIETNGMNRLRAPIPKDTVFRDFMNVGLPREIFINHKPEIFAFIALVYWDAVYKNVHCVII